MESRFRKKPVKRIKYNKKDKPKGVMLTRDKLILDEVMKGRSDRQISEDLGIHRRTIRNRMNKKHFKEALRHRQRRAMKRQEITEDLLIERLWKMFDGSFGDIIKFDEDGKPFIDFEGASPELLNSIQGLEAETVMVGRGEDKKPVTKVKVRQVDRMKVMEHLMKLLGFGQKQQVEISGDDELIKRLMGARGDRYGEEQS